MDLDVHKKETDEADGVDKKETDVSVRAVDAQGGGGNGGDTGEEVIYIDVEVDDTKTSQVQNRLASDINVVLVSNARSIFNRLKRKRNPGKFNMSPYTTLPDTTPRALRRRSSRINHENISPPKAPDFSDALQLPPLEPFVEVYESLIPS